MGGVNTWGEITVDEKRGIAYFPLGSPTYDYDGADREGEGLYGDCILALDAGTGKELWHFQTVHHDLWDYDLSAAPQLITVNHEGRKVDAVAVASKNGFLYVFDRVTGKPLWPIVEKPVHQSTMPQEHSWPTQPIPTVIPPFDRHVVTVADMNPYFPPAEKEKWTTRIKAARSGLFEHLSDQYETLSMPGSVGGCNYGNTAADPDKGLVYVMFQELPDFYRLQKRAAGPEGYSFAGNPLFRGRAVFQENCQVCHGADRKGLPGGGPSLENIGTKLGPDAFKSLLSQGRGRMPSFPHFDPGTVKALYAFLGSSVGRTETPAAKTPSGPVVASGGVKLPGQESSYSGRMKDYPAGYKGPRVQYVEAHNWGVGVPNLLSPPFAGIAAYDLNKGTLRWKIPLGDDYMDGLKGTGTPNGTQNKGMIVTASGLLFATCKDGLLRAIDASNGKIIWQYDLGRRDPGGIPAMYEIKGKQYLVVCSTGPLSDSTASEKSVPKGYIVFSLGAKR